MVATRDGYEAMWEREYAAALGCEFCDPALIAAKLAALRGRRDPVEEPDSEDSMAHDDEDRDEEDQGDEFEEELEF